MRIQSVHESGGNGIIVSAETSLSNGLPSIVLVGFAGKSLDESRERIRSAFSNSNLSLPKKRITVNISPSDVPKDGAHYDLAIAISILQEAKMIKVAQTIADLENTDEIRKEHLAEALQYRPVQKI